MEETNSDSVRDESNYRSAVFCMYDAKSCIEVIGFLISDISLEKKIRARIKTLTLVLINNLYSFRLRFILFSYMRSVEEDL